MSVYPERDRWMVRWLPALQAHAGSGPVLELGCDTGGDTSWLLAQGLRVIATDISHEALRSCAAAAPGALLVRHDLRCPLPLQDGTVGVVVASLCLHYFEWRTTVGIVAGIARCLRFGGLLLCRLNAIDDVLHGAGSGEQIEPHLYRVEGARYAQTKRFFDSTDVERLWDGADWHMVHRELTTIMRYDAPKRAWELALHRR